MSAVPLETVLERRTERCSPVIVFGIKAHIPVARQGGNHGSDTSHQAGRRQIPFILSVQYVVLSHFHINIQVCQLLLPSGTDGCVFLVTISQMRMCLKTHEHTVEKDYSSYFESVS